MNNEPNRREFLKSCGRLAAAGGLAAISAFCLTREGSPECALLPCSGCGEFESCALPKAAAFRETAGKDK